MSRTRSAELTIRVLDRHDGASVRRLAGRDSAPIPALPLLGALRAGRLVAAVSLADPQAGPIADPFLPTAGTVELLALRADQLRATEGRRPRPSLRNWIRGRPAQRSCAALAGSPPGGGGRLLQL